MALDQSNQWQVKEMAGQGKKARLTSGYCHILRRFGASAYFICFSPFFQGTVNVQSLYPLVSCNLSSCLSTPWSTHLSTRHTTVFLKSGHESVKPLNFITLLSTNFRLRCLFPKSLFPKGEFGLEEIESGWHSDNLWCL